MGVRRKVPCLFQMLFHTAFIRKNSRAESDGRRCFHFHDTADQIILPDSFCVIFKKNSPLSFLHHNVSRLLLLSRHFSERKRLSRRHVAAARFSPERTDDFDLFSFIAHAINRKARRFSRLIYMIIVNPAFPFQHGTFRKDSVVSCIFRAV